MIKRYSQKEWDELIAKYPNGTLMSGTASNQQMYGVWVTLDELPEVPALLEIIHFEIIETDPEHKIQFPVDYPAVGASLKTRVLAWCEKPNDVRLTQLSHLEWSHRRFLHEQSSSLGVKPDTENGSV